MKKRLQEILKEDPSGSQNSKIREKQKEIIEKDIKKSKKY